MQRFGSKVNNFWEPGYEPESDKTAFKPKDVDKESFIDFVFFCGSPLCVAMPFDFGENWKSNGIATHAA